MTSRTADPTTLSQRAVEGLLRETGGVLDRATVEAVLADSAARLGAARGAACRPALAYRFARERLTDTAAARGLLPRSAPVVLFVSSHDAVRGPLAAALLEHAADGRVVVRSAGAEPAADLPDDVVDVLAEVGVDVAGAFPKPLAPEALAAADVVVHLGAEGTVEVPEGCRALRWDLPEPAADTDGLRALRDDLAGRVQLLLHELLEPQPGSVLDDALLRLLADPLRARVVELLAGEALCTSHLVALTGARQSNISNHLKLLREAGLTRTEPCGRFTYNLLEPARLRALGEALLALAATAEAGVPRRSCP